VVFEDGLQSRDFVHVSDIVQANLLAMETDAANYDVFNVGTGRSLSVLDVANALTGAMGVAVQPEIVAKYRQGDIRHCFSDISKAERVLGYRPRVRFEDGVPELVAWARTQESRDLVGRAVQELEERRLTR
jgi:dTDP-L-rhamnose 4-epimerase